MCQTQKEALFNLVIVVFALAAVAMLYPILGRGATGGFGILGFLGFSLLFYRRRRAQVLTDERDQLIRRRSTIFAYTVFWVAFVASSMLALAFYGDDGAVPVPVVLNGVWLGLAIVVGMQSLATLAQYGMGSANARS
jgi:uncharacterized membrane protein